MCSTVCRLRCGFGWRTEGFPCPRPADSSGCASLTGLPPVALGPPRGVSPPPGGERGDVPPLDAGPPPSAASAADSGGGLRGRGEKADRSIRNYFLRLRNCVVFHIFAAWGCCRNRCIFLRQCVSFPANLSIAASIFCHVSSLVSFVGR